MELLGFCFGWAMLQLICYIDDSNDPILREGNDVREKRGTIVGVMSCP